MKNRYLLLILISIAIYACTITGSEEIDQSLDSKVVTNTFKLTESSNVEFISERKVKCCGTCDGSETKCELEVSTSDPNIKECSCEGCTMHVSSGFEIAGTESEPDFSEMSQAQTFSNEFVDHVKGEFLLKGIDRIKIKELTIQDYTDLRIAIYEYYDSYDELKTVMIAKRKDLSSSFGRTDSFISEDPGYVVDCSGGCDAAGATCRERFNFNEGTAECTCGGECNMTITPKK